MSFELPSRRAATHTAPTWAGMALIVETMVLLLFLVASLAVITEVFADATVRARRGEELARAVAAVTTVAERFAADPVGTGGTTTENGMVVSCVVSAENAGAGTLWHATVTAVSPTTGDELYTLATAHYEREASR